MENQIKVYVYGDIFKSTSGNEEKKELGEGGYGVVITLNDEKIKELSEKVPETNKSRMDLTGIIEGLENVIGYSDIIVYLNNGYIIDAITKGWLEKWKEQNYENRIHSDLWIKLDQALQSSAHFIKFEHSDNARLHDFYREARTIAKVKSGKKKLTANIELNTFKKKIKVSRKDFDSDSIDWDSICVDVSCINNPGPMEFRGIHTQNKQLLFERRYDFGTNNIGEFLSIVYALALFKKENKELKVLYSDSYVALAWVKEKKCKTNLERNKENALLFTHIDRAVKWLETNEYETKILKWKTDLWGEIPADYGRK